MFLGKDVVIYGLANAFAKLFSIMLVPVLVAMLSKEQYGMVDGVSMLISLFLPLIIFGQDSAIARYYYELKEDRERSQMISQALVVQVVLGLITFTVLEGLALTLSKHYIRSEESTRLIRLAGISLLFSFFNQFAANVLKWTFRRIPFLIITVVYPVSTILLTIFLMKNVGKCPEYVFISQIISGVIFSVIAFFFIRKQLTFRLNHNWYKRLLTYGWPYFLIMFLPVLLPSLDRYFIAKYVDLGSLGLYALAFRIASLVQLPVFGFQTAWGPFAFSIYKESNADKIYDIVLKLYLLILLLFCLILNIFLVPVIELFADQEYIGASVLIIPILLAIALESCSWISGMGIELSKKTYLSAIAYTVGLLVGVACTWYGVSRFGILGLVWSGVAVKLIFSMLKTFLAYKVYPLKYDFKGVLILIGLGIGFNIYLNYFIQLNSLAIRMGIGTIMCIALLFAYWFLLLDKMERNIIKNKLKK